MLFTSRIEPLRLPTLPEKLQSVDGGPLMVDRFPDGLWIASPERMERETGVWEP